MNNYLSLTKVLFKNSLGMFQDGKNKKGTNILIGIILVVCLLPTIFSFYFLFTQFFEIMIPIGQEGLVLSIGMMIASVLIFIFSIFLIPSIYYFSKDAPVLLALPLSPKTIIASKFTVAILYEYIFVFLFFTPLMIAYINTCSDSVIAIMIMIFAALTLPVYPLILSSLITILMMSLMPFMKRKDTFNIVGSILIVAVAFIFSYYSTRLENVSDMEMIAMLMSGNNSLLNIMNFMFPALNLMAKAIMNLDVLSLFMYLGIHLIAIMIILIIAEKLYFKGVIGVDETGSSHKIFTSKEMHQKTKQNAVLIIYIKKEFRILYRTPAYLMNNLLMSIIPAFCIGITAFSEDMKQIITLLPLDTMINSEFFIPGIIISGLIAGYAFSNMTMVSCTAISREGSNYIFMKYIPVSLKTQINAKVCCGIIVSIVTAIFTIIPIYLLFPLPLMYYGLFLIASVLSIIVGNYVGICMDIMHPKLIWEQEAMAVKQNINGFFALMGGIAISIILGYIAFKIPTHALLTYCIILLLISFILCILFYRYAQKLVIKAFKNI